MKTYSSIMLVVDETMGCNGLEYGYEGPCRRFLESFDAVNESEAKAICEAVGVIYDGEVLGLYDGDIFPKWG